MKLEKRDIAEALGLVYVGESVKEGHHNYYHTFCFCGKTVQESHEYIDLDTAWEVAAEKVLEPLIEMLKEQL